LEVELALGFAFIFRNKSLFCASKKINMQPKQFFFFVTLLLAFETQAQSLLTPEMLLSLGRVSAKGLSKDGSVFYYSVSTPSLDENKNKTAYFAMPSSGGTANEVPSFPAGETVTIEKEGENIKLSPDGKKVIFTREVKMQKIQGYEHYPSFAKSNALIYDNLNQRHWDTWEDGNYSHIFLAENIAGFALREKDLMQNEIFDCPQKPFGGEEDLLFSPDGNQVLYVTKKKTGKEYALSTNTDIYAYDIATGNTENLTRIQYLMRMVLNLPGLVCNVTVMKLIRTNYGLWIGRPKRRHA
jgi:dipeptidyl aminopeptidase/acylaminoacyl peptidase